MIIGPIYRLTLRALLLQRRTILLVLLALAPVLVAFIYAVAAKQGAHQFRFYSHMMQELFVPTIAAVVALVIGVSALGDERVAAGKKSVALRLTFRAADRTLTDAEVDAQMAAAESLLVERAGAERR